MMEFELKLEIPTHRLKAVEAAVRRGHSVQQRLQARYFDTHDAALAAQGVVVRLRKEGRQWLQTAKAPGLRPLERLEHNVVLSTRGAPVVDLARHLGTPVGKRIRQALKLKPSQPFPPLELVYETDVTRLTRVVSAGGTSVEIALDTGHIAAGKHSLPLSELELELKQGSQASAVELARSWCLAHGLWLSSISKSMKGQRLAQDQAFGAPVSARAPRYASGRDLAAAVVASCLNQILANASEVAGGCSGEEHIHQLRVGLRRLRTALREFGALTEDFDSAWDAPLALVFRELGLHRDRDYLLHTVQRQIEAAGGPALDWRDALADLPDVCATVRSPGFQEVLLGLIGFVHAAPAEGKAQELKKVKEAKAAKKIVRRRLRKLHQQVLSEGQTFLGLDEPAQHHLRKRLKRLHYVAEFSKDLFAKRQVEAFLSALKPMQDALGLYHDELAALQAWQQLCTHDPQAWFGVGWLSARRAANAQACQQACETFAQKAKPFWD
ncbi:Inorganic triphosphatase YgiF, contains CYTH and CHAD domains [Polaromonas sp. OV174]|nr:Inorganic triphosphatase YgiF, contains CYTH and CHAD domains [Polaromonas sp. OV174]